MEEGSWSDWERLFARCATDAAYRSALGEALNAKDAGRVVSLLTEIGAEGPVGAAREERVLALMNAREPMIAVADAFEADVRMAP